MKKLNVKQEKTAKTLKKAWRVVTSESSEARKARIDKWISENPDKPLTLGELDELFNFKEVEV